jgi:hypothetical protein
LEATRHFNASTISGGEFDEILGRMHGCSVDGITLTSLRPKH